MALPSEIAALIATFAANEADYTEAYKDVIQEDALKIGGETKAPDYSFRIGDHSRVWRVNSPS